MLYGPKLPFSELLVRLTLRKSFAQAFMLLRCLSVEACTWLRVALPWDWIRLTCWSKECSWPPLMGLSSYLLDASRTGICCTWILAFLFAFRWVFFCNVDFFLISTIALEGCVPYLYALLFLLVLLIETEWTSGFLLGFIIVSPTGEKVSEIGFFAESCETGDRVSPPPTVIWTSSPVLRE